MPTPFDPQNELNDFEQTAKRDVDQEIDQNASRVPGGEQVAQQAKDAADRGIDQAGQQVSQDAEQQMKDRAGGLGDQLGGMFGDQSNSNP